MKHPDETELAVNWCLEKVRSLMTEGLPEGRATQVAIDLWQASPERMDAIRRYVDHQSRIERTSLTASIFELAAAKKR